MKLVCDDPLDDLMEDWEGDAQKRSLKAAWLGSVLAKMRETHEPDVRSLLAEEKEDSELLA